ncbi:4Fe-4S cluster-binding protein [Thermococcus kodakarensis KOD1]|uniref:4Fe-4S cluster-binding protein n=1 Tax=Thermococcus kodakarensis (strain ATCC BAA-918 / JCM 12380 / KOD1) TaxID=69014 RepID=Q5JHW1_THEKO|nr:4Fe-4S dicluster domain-containing protein [Thermococcus kodakarensis]WCN27933.1 4Fe-4S binding protein [Thermococcus kodakarensis]WCN30232.1 4Fe-4S binding protein [Thermococcus kodakarensis]BAD86264.1 4Fe-4S cluster-binding protein [Thermococcus kodakarensis KOD1]
MTRRILHVDYSLCIGCETCEGVCDFIHGGRPNIKVYYTITGIPVPINCRHCEKAPCMDVCPAGAIYRDSDGAVIINPNKCIGCLMCLAACPFGVPTFDVKLKAVTKCDMCADRRRLGTAPACAEMCPAGAIFFGKPEEVEEKVRRRTAEKIARERLAAVNLEGVGRML